VEVHTLMGKITFRDIGQPQKIKEMIIEQQKLAFEREYHADIQAIEELIRERIEPAPDELEEEMEISSGESGIPVTARPSPIWETVVNFFKTRVEDKGIITYRKHIYILFRKVFLPSLLIFLLIVLDGFLLSAGIDGSIVMLLSSVAFIGLGLWWLYQFVDWRNDIYRVSYDKIIDSERKPLGSEVTKSAYLENILSLDYERLGLLGILLNFGNVIINVGTENKFIFWRIHDPARAQQDIFNRMYTNRRAKEQAESAKEREHMAELFAAYDRQSKGDNRNQNSPDLDRDAG
jgi:hypothetical protein